MRCNLRLKLPFHSLNLSDSVSHDEMGGDFCAFVELL